MRIYYVEDETNIRELIQYTLECSGYSVSGFSCAEQFWKVLEEEIPDLILLDLMLPGEDGMQILKKLKGNPTYQEIPVILVTAKGAEYDKVSGLDCGADDYITKPFGMMEFLARVRAVIRRSGTERQKSHELEYGGIILDRKKHEVQVQGEKINLTLKEFELLQYLMENQGNVLTRESILENIWGYDFIGETRTVDVHIRTLRHKLGVCGERVETVRGVGYRMGGS